jgi:nucleoid-associated protein YgaU
MFTAMISRRVLIALPGLALALGVGWAAFELGRGRFADAPQTATGAPESEQASGEGAGPEARRPPSSAVDAGAPSGSEPSVEAPAAASIGSPDPPQAAAPGGRAESAEEIARQRSPAADEATSGELESAETERPAPPATSAVLPRTGPAEAGATRQPSGEDTAGATAPQAGGVDARSASSGGAPAPARATEERADGGSPTTVPPQPSVAAPAPADAPPSPSAAPVLAERPVDEPRSTRERAVETLKRALATLFGGAADEPVPPRAGAEVAAVPETASGAPDRESEAGDLEPGAAPSFDIVRIGPGGRAVMAGRAAPGAEVEIRSGDRLIDRVRADRRGEWVALPPQPLDAGLQELSLVARAGDQPAIDSEEVVVLGVPEPGPPDIALGPLDEAALPVQITAGVPTDEAFAVALPREGAGGGRILQAPGRISSDGALALLMVDYDDAGRIRLSGEATAGSALRIYVDNEPAATATVGPSGKWDAVLEDTLTPGDYMLRLDQLGATGKPDARLETPFTRVSDPPVAGDVRVDYVIVQPGNSLWRIARRVLGEGMRYVHIFEANQAQIRDPDLIYPGQVFEVPTALGAAG